MHYVNMLEAKTTLSKLVDQIERGIEKEVIIARHGRPAARLVPIEACVAPAQRIGIAKGLVIPDNIDQDNEEVARLFFGKV
ncbi:type II toxin-antitoxin system Phd/YefM family antitoxin [Alkanindiges sp. WGS2144]|uniref:type II toxin-antitoxin system Phd/YefM family antitoxin n=1 Tax=Alkanindiges sp. WGS2144 TaxID=3366808 RepID=UPI003752D5B7